MRKPVLLLMLVWAFTLQAQMTPVGDGVGWELAPQVYKHEDIHIFPSQVGVDTTSFRRLFIPYDVLGYNMENFYLYPMLEGETSPRQVPLFLNLGDVGHVFQTVANYSFAKDGRILFVGKPVKYFLVVRTPGVDNVEQ